MAADPLVRPAADPDAPRVVALRDDLARWQAARGIDQWQVGDVTVATVLEQVRAGEWWVVDGPRGPAGLVRLVWSDPLFWDDLVPADDDAAGYVHGLMVARTASGTGLGERLLAWAERRTAATGRPYARLDCAADNPVLRVYYAGHGYAPLGAREIRLGRRTFVAERWQKPLTGTVPAPD